jgi:hypothetical protein
MDPEARGNPLFLLPAPHQEDTGLHKKREADKRTNTDRKGKPSMGAAWLKCDLKKGMFSNEFVACYPPKGTCASSFFVAKEFVQGGIGKPGRVKVQCAKRGEDFWVVLPTEDQQVIKVQPADVTNR